MNKKIIIVTPALGKGGAETQLIKIARFLKLQNKEILIISLKHKNDFSAILMQEGINVLLLKNNWTLNFIPNIYNLFRTIKNYKPDVTIAFMFIAIIVARILKGCFRFRLISSVRAARIDKKWEAMFRLTSKLDDIVVFNSFASKAIFEKDNLTRKEGIVIKNAVTVPYYDCLEITTNGPFKWISVAHFRVDKDYQTLFKAIAILKKNNFQIDIIGDLYDLKWPEQMILELGIQDRVNLLGFKSDCSDYLKNSNALILSSFSEGMPNAILEAMAYSKPVVASDIDSISEIFRDFQGGLLFRTGDPVDLAEKMLAIMKMKEGELKNMGAAGRINILNNFEESLVLKQWLQLVETF